MINFVFKLGILRYVNDILLGKKFFYCDSFLLSICSKFFFVVILKNRDSRIIIFVLWSGYWRLRLLLFIFVLR